MIQPQLLPCSPGSGTGTFALPLPRAPIPFSTVVINLASRPDRLEHMGHVLHAAGLPAARFEALTGDQASLTEVTSSWDSTLNSRFDDKTMASTLKMSKGERGCAGSHLRLWQAAAQLPLHAPPVLVLEDDVCL